MENTEQTTKKIFVGANLAPAVYTIVDQLRTEEDRPMSNMIERLLKTHPRVQEILEASETAAVSA